MREASRGHAARVLLAAGPGLIVMVADNDACTVSSYTEAGARTGTQILSGSRPRSGPARNGLPDPARVTDRLLGAAGWPVGRGPALGGHTARRQRSGSIRSPARSRSSSSPPACWRCAMRCTAGLADADPAQMASALALLIGHSGRALILLMMINAVLLGATRLRLGLGLGLGLERWDGLAQYAPSQDDRGADVRRRLSPSSSASKCWISVQVLAGVMLPSRPEQLGEPDRDRAPLRAVFRPRPPGDVPTLVAPVP